MPYPFVSPDLIEPETSAFLCVPMRYIPFFRLFFQAMQRRQTWQDHAAWMDAYHVFAQMESELMSNCLQGLVDELRALRGLKPEFESVPEIDRTIDMYRSLNDLLAGMELMRGIVSGETLGSIADLVLALRGTDAPADHVLQALRGDDAASDTRNVVDLLE